MQKKETISSIIIALCELGIGVLLLIDPLGFTSMSIIVLGIVLVVAGVIDAISYFRDEPVSGFVRQSLAIGLAEIAAGLFCIFRYDWFIVTFPLLTFVYGIFMLLTVFSKIQWTVDMIRMRQKKWYLAAISAVVSLLCAGVILSNPFASTAALWMFVAISLVAEAIVDVVVLILRKRN